MDRLSSPDQLDQLMRVTSPRSWLILIGLTAVILAAILWGFVGNVPRTVSGQSILIQPGGLTRAVATSPGLVVEVTAVPGQEVGHGDVVAWLINPTTSDPDASAGTSATPAGEGRIAVTSPVSGRVLEVLTSPGHVLDIGDAVLSLEGTSDSVVAMVYVDDGPGKQIEPGMEVQVSPSIVDKAQYGYIRGTVVSVSEYPVTKLGLMQLLENEPLVDRILDDGPVLQVQVELKTNPATPSGFQWSSPEGPPYEISHGTLAEATIVINTQRPVQYVVPGS